MVKIAVSGRNTPAALPLAARPELATQLGAMLRAAQMDGCSLELALVDDARMEELNLAATGNPGPTNILSFPAGEARERGDEPPFLGWMALSEDTLLRECLLYGQEPAQHCARLLAHGLAHLTGLDHGPEHDALSAIFEEAAACVG